MQQIQKNSWFSRARLVKATINQISNQRKMSVDLSSDFPVWALLPKRETTISNFLNKYPEYDGRGVTIAICDSGVDPGAAGLQKTSDGKVKIIHMIDASGAGDVDTSTVVESVDGMITGLSGKQLKIPSSWKNPTNKYHLGIKNGYELYPKALKERMKKEFKEKIWDPLHKFKQAEALRIVQEFNSQHSNSSQVLTQEQKLIKEECEAQLDVLNSLEKKYNDCGPAYDCVVFHDGTMWRAVVDTTEVGDLGRCTLLGPYSETHQYATLTASDQLNYTVNFYNEGNLLEIVSTSSAHGTHVASIAAACFPDEPEKNGVAPGAQLVSIAIGESRVGTMETGTALVRGLIKIINTHCDVINESYGEQSHWSGGRVMEMFNQTINRHGVIMCSSAGNDGPALSTITAPANDQTKSIIGVGAYVSPDMMIAEYSMREKKPGQSYTWNSRGPGLNGDMTLSVCAPGGAITSVPNWCLTGCQMMNGSSMSSPNVTGCIAVLLSGLKAKKIPYSPYSVRRAIENTAIKPSNYEVFSMGHGLIQVEGAFEYLLKYSTSIDRDLRFDISCDGKRGIYLREYYKTLKPSFVIVTVEPLFLDSMSASPEKKINYQQNFKLSCDAPWVSVPENLSLMYTSRAFSVKVDPCGLQLGEHFAWIKAYDCTCIEKGAVFNIAVTVIISKSVEETDSWKINYPSRLISSDKVFRDFINVPAGATWAELKMKSYDAKNILTARLHAVQVHPHFSTRSFESLKLLRLGPKEEVSHLLQVQEKVVLELAITQWWAQQDPVMVDYSVCFHGLLPAVPQITMHAADGIQRVDVSSVLSYELMSPAVSLKSHVMVYRPVENKISPLKERDIIPDGRQIYEMQLTYNISIFKSTEIQVKCSLLSELLYESEYESQLWMLFDGNKQLIGAGDAYPNRYPHKIEKGDYVIKLQIRHEQKNLLEKITDLPLLIQAKLPSAITLDIYEKQSAAIVGGRKSNSRILPPGAAMPVFVAPLPHDKLPKNAAPGHYLLGTITYSKDEEVRKIDTFPFKYIIPDAPKKASTPKPVEKEKNLDEEFSEAVRDLKVSWIAKLQGKTSKEIFEESIAKDPQHLPLLLARLHSLDQDKERSTHLLSIVQLADQILSLVDTTELMAFFGAKGEKKDLPNNKIQEKQKSTVIEALTKKGVALCDYLVENGGKSSPDAEGDNAISPKVSAASEPEDKSEEEAQVQPSLSEINKVYFELQRWIDMTDAKVAHFTEKHALAHGHYGRALKLLLKQQDEKSIRETDKKCIDLFQKLDWIHCGDFLQRSLLVRYPLAYRLF